MEASGIGSLTTLVTSQALAGSKANIRAFLRARHLQVIPPIPNLTQWAVCVCVFTTHARAKRRR